MDPVDQSATPVGDEQPATRLDRERERVVEAVGEGANATGAGIDRDDLAPPAVARVLPPLGDVQPAAPEGEAVRRAMRLEVGEGRGHSGAVADEPARLPARPAVGPAVAPAAARHDD